MSDSKQNADNLRFLWASGNLYAEKNPSLSQYFISKFHKLLPSKTTVDGQALNTLYCSHCFNLLRLDNHVARLLPKRSMSARIRKIKCRARKQGLQCLSKDEACQLKLWEDSQVKLSIKCKSCQGTTKNPGSKRCIRQPKQEGRRKLTAKRKLQQQHDEQQVKREQTKTPVTPRLDFSLKQGQMNSPRLTPLPQGYGASAGVTPSVTPTASARKARNLNKQNHQQLLRMLDGARREKANSESPLKDFLVSLRR